MKKSFFFSITVFIVSFSFGQERVLSGVILDSITERPLVGASIFIDGTTVGTISNTQGRFSLPLFNTVSSAFVVSFLGYENRIFENILNVPDTILLKEHAVQLSGVTLEPDTWSREKKLNIFLREFLGDAYSNGRCTIKNREGLDLRYIPSKKVLKVYAEEPLIVENSVLGYDLKYYLQNCEIFFQKYAHRDDIVIKVFYSGVTSFREAPGKLSARITRKRKKAFKGSVLHFMRSLREGQLRKEGFVTYKKGFPIDDKTVFTVKKTEKMSEVSVQKGIIQILYKSKGQSSIIPQITSFFIDANGNHTPVHAMFFSGAFGEQRVSDLLPLDYDPDKI